MPQGANLRDSGIRGGPSSIVPPAEELIAPRTSTSHPEASHQTSRHQAGVVTERLEEHDSKLPNDINAPHTGEKGKGNEEGKISEKRSVREKRQPRSEIHNRLMAILVHISWYSFKTQARLAEDSGLSKAAISRIIRGFHRPSYPAALLITRAIENRLQHTIDPREIFSLDGAYPTPSVCTLVGCRNCLPDAAYGDNGVIRPEYQELKAGQWSMSSSTLSPSTISPSTQTASFPPQAMSSSTQTISSSTQTAPPQIQPVQ